MPDRGGARPPAEAGAVGRVGRLAALYVKYCRYVPYLVLVVLMVIFEPEHKTSNPTCPPIVLVGGILMALGMLRVVYLLSQKVRLAVVVALLPTDVLFTHLSHLRYGDWSFEFGDVMTF